CTDASRLRAAAAALRTPDSPTLAAVNLPTWLEAVVKGVAKATGVPAPLTGFAWLFITSVQLAPLIVVRGSDGVVRPISVPHAPSACAYEPSLDRSSVPSSAHVETIARALANMIGRRPWGLLAGDDEDGDTADQTSRSGLCRVDESLRRVLRAAAVMAAHRRPFVVTVPRDRIDDSDGTAGDTSSRTPTRGSDDSAIESLAALLALLEPIVGGALPDSIVQPGHVHCANMLHGRINEARAHLAVFFAPEDVRCRAERLLEILRRRGRTIESRRDLHRASQRDFVIAGALDAPLALLAELGILDRLPREPPRIGRPRGPTFSVNPHLFDAVAALNEASS
ncbi:MAG: hypothetical protein ACHREM_27880, partial [Polyangiales bacterium]